MTFQEIILSLQAFWINNGCILQQPYDTEKGAGTMNPATFLRALGPEPWAVCYVEPSRRPADGRYGDNPNRLFQHHQFQVVIKPSLDNIQELYLGSLEALGSGMNVVVCDSDYCPTDTYFKGLIDQHVFVCDPYSKKSIHKAMKAAYELDTPRTNVLLKFNWANTGYETFKVYEKLV